MKYKIEKARSKEDFDNGNYKPSDGGVYSAKDAVRILEAGHGGCITDDKGNSSIVSYDSSANGWVKNKLNIK